MVWTPPFLDFDNRRSGLGQWKGVLREGGDSTPTHRRSEVPR